MAGEGIWAGQNVALAESFDVRQKVIMTVKPMAGIGWAVISPQNFLLGKTQGQIYRFCINTRK